MSFEALELALALHAAPGRIGELRARPLPTQGMAPLLRVALGQPDALAEAAAVFPADSHRLIDAARFFIEQQLLAREFDHDPWRVLGVNAGAAPELVRAHHHLLVRLVHPDRSDDWASAYADRVNRAWRQLRSDEGRAEALSRVAPVRPIEPWEPQPAPRRRQAPVVSEAQATATSRRSARPLPWIAAGIAIAVTAAVGLQQLRRASVSTPQAEESVATAEPAEPWYDTPAPVPAPPEPLPEMVPIATLAKPVATNAEPAVTPSAPSVQPVAAVRTRAPEVRPRPPAAGPAAPSVVMAPPPTPEPVATEVAAEPLPVAEAEPKVEPAPALDAADGPVLLRRFRERYAEGDLGGLLGLYAREVHADTQRLANLASGYTRLFGSSQQRYIDFSAVTWQQRGEQLFGQARYETGYRKRASLRKHLERGDVAIEVVFDGRESRLRRFELRAD